jgi:hypothetical protein
MINDKDKAWMLDDTRVFKETPAMQELRSSNVSAFGYLLSMFEGRMKPQDIEKDELRAVYLRGIYEMVKSDRKGS